MILCTILRQMQLSSQLRVMSVLGMVCCMLVAVSAVPHADEDTQFIGQV